MSANTESPIRPPHGCLTGYDVISITGEARTEFLNALVCADIRFAATGSSLVTAWCNAKGRVEFVVRLLFGAQEIAILCRPQDTEALVARLKRFSIRRAVEIRHADSWYVIAGSGPESGETPFADVVTGRWLGLTEQPDALADVQALWEAGDITGLVPLARAADNAEFLPQMLNLADLDGLSFKKGCYPGQEVIARLHFRGELKRHLVAGRSSAGDAPAPGTTLYASAAQRADGGLREPTKVGVVVGSAPVPAGDGDGWHVQMVVAIDAGDELQTADGRNITVARKQTGA